jgi:hypothetical protein
MRPVLEILHNSLFLCSCSLPPVFRLWQNHHPSAFFWSKKGIYRFDSKSARYGVLYTGGTLEGAALEVFGDQWVKRRVLSRVLLKKYRVSVMLPTRRLSLVDTTGSNLNLDQARVIVGIVENPEAHRAKVYPRSRRVHLSGDC